MLKDIVMDALRFLKQYPNVHLYPAFWNGKEKQHIGLVKWATESSNDPNVITAWGAQFKDNAYFCINLRKSKMTVVDVDNKKGKAGSENLDMLFLEHGSFPETLQVCTPSGGDHFYFFGEARMGANRLAAGVDIPVMVPLAGTTVPGKGKYEIVEDAPILELPAWVTELAGEQIDHEERKDTVVTLDQPHNIQRAKAYVEGAEPAIEGQGGDNTTFKVLTRVRDFGISPEICRKLADIYNEKNCHPQWSAADLDRLVANAYSYARSTQGITDPTQEFEPIAPADADLFKFSHAQDLVKKYKPPVWLIKPYLEEATNGFFHGLTGSYKTFAVLDMGLHIAAGIDYQAMFKVKQGSVFYVAGEGAAAVRRRVKGWLQHHAVLHKIPFYVSDQVVNLDDKETCVKFIKSMQFYSSKEPVRLVIMDTLATVSGDLKENDTDDMKQYITLTNKIRDVLNCTVVTVHHPGHNNQERMRGSSVLKSGLDFAFLVDSPEPDICHIVSDKQKDGEKPADIHLSMAHVNLGQDEDLQTITTLVPTLNTHYRPPVRVANIGENQRTLYEIMYEQPNRQMRRSDLRDAYNALKFGNDPEEVRRNRNSFPAALKALLEKGYFGVDGGIVKMLLSLEGIACNQQDLEDGDDEF